MIGLGKSVLPSEWEIKAHLIETYNPRVSYGMPKVVSEEEMQRKITNNMDLARFVRNYFKTEDISKIYRIIKQMENISLSNDYSKFSLKDGRMNEVTEYKGEIWFTGNSINSKITTKKKRKIPC